jgi:ParB-like chromosome segregation protein Spo0J
MSAEYEFHEIANVFPLLEYEDFSKLIEDIRAHGLIEPITLYEEKILDGRNRYRACIAAGVAPRYLVYDGDDPAAFVWSKNDVRRQMSASQRAMAATALLPYLKAQAKERQGTRTDIVSKSTQSPPAATARVSGRAREHAAKIAGVGATTMGEAETLARAAQTSPEAQTLVEQATAGETTVHAAVQELKALETVEEVKPKAKVKAEVKPKAKVEVDDAEDDVEGDEAAADRARRVNNALWDIDYMMEGYQTGKHILPDLDELGGVVPDH